MAGTLFEHADTRLGDSEARKALCFLSMWALVRDAVGHSPTASDYCAWWAMVRTPFGADTYRARVTLRLADPTS